MLPEDYPALHGAFKSWRRGDYARMIEESLSAIGLDDVCVANLAWRRSWSFNQDSAAVYIIYDQRREEVSVESPMLKLARTKRVAMMRTLLEMNARVLGASKFCLRDDTVILRFVELGKHLPPPLLASAIGEVAALADKFDDILAMTFEARMLGPIARRSGYSIEMLGQPTQVPLVADRVEAAAKERAGCAGQGEGGVLAKVKGLFGANSKAATSDLTLEMLDEMRSVLDLAMVLNEKGATGMSHAMLLRAHLYVLHGRYVEGAPRVGWWLLNQGRMLLTNLPPDRHAFLMNAEESGKYMRALHLYSDIKSVVVERGQIEAQAPVPFDIPRFASKRFLSGFFDEFFGLLDGVVRSNSLHIHIMIGALYELLVRVKLDDAQRAQVTGVIDRARGSSASSKEARVWLRRELEHVARELVK